MNTDERYATLANRAKLVFVTSVVVVAAVQQKPLLLLFAPTEHVLAWVEGDAPSLHRFSCFCTTCASFAWLTYALGVVAPYGSMYALVAIEALTWDTPILRVFPTHFALVCLVWLVCVFAPALILLPAVLVPMIERRRLASLLRIPVVCVALITTHA